MIELKDTLNRKKVRMNNMIIFWRAFALALLCVSMIAAATLLLSYRVIHFLRKAKQKVR